MPEMKGWMCDIYLYMRREARPFFRYPLGWGVPQEVSTGAFSAARSPRGFIAQHPRPWPWLVVSIAHLLLTNKGIVLHRND